MGVPKIVPNLYQRRTLERIDRALFRIRSKVQVNDTIIVSGSVGWFFRCDCLRGIPPTRFKATSARHPEPGEAGQRAGKPDERQGELASDRRAAWSGEPVAETTVWSDGRTTGGVTLDAIKVARDVTRAFADDLRLALQSMPCYERVIDGNVSLRSVFDEKGHVPRPVEELFQKSAVTGVTRGGAADLGCFVRGFTFRCDSEPREWWLQMLKSNLLTR